MRATTCAQNFPPAVVLGGAQGGVAVTSSPVLTVRQVQFQHFGVFGGGQAEGWGGREVGFGSL